MTESSRHRWHLRPRFGVVVALALLLNACSGDEVTATAPAAADTTSTSPASASLILAGALKAYDAGYEFRSEAMVGSAQAAVVEGTHIAGSAQMAISSGDGVVEYLVVGDTRWARSDPDELWNVVSEDGADHSPLDSLADPRAIELVSKVGTVVTLEAVYPAAAFGVSGPDLTVIVIIESGRLTSASYTTSQDGIEGRVESTFGALSETTQITAPVE